jgi:hypothetical protein
MDRQGEVVLHRAGDQLAVLSPTDRLVGMVPLGATSREPSQGVCPVNEESDGKVRNR